ncbi:MAG: hypothetical protein WC644_05430 [Ignavibacteria bacterium]
MIRSPIKAFEDDKERKSRKKDVRHGASLVCITLCGNDVIRSPIKTFGDDKKRERAANRMGALPKKEQAGIKTGVDFVLIKKYLYKYLGRRAYLPY